MVLLFQYTVDKYWTGESNATIGFAPTAGACARVCVHVCVWCSGTSGFFWCSKHI